MYFKVWTPASTGFCKMFRYLLLCFHLYSSFQCFPLSSKPQYNPLQLLLGSSLCQHAARDIPVHYVTYCLVFAMFRDRKWLTRSRTQRDARREDHFYLQTCVSARMLHALRHRTLVSDTRLDWLCSLAWSTDSDRERIASLRYVCVRQDAVSECARSFVAFQCMKCKLNPSQKSSIGPSGV
jgi:hypothetical protein